MSSAYTQDKALRSPLRRHHPNTHLCVQTIFIPRGQGNERGENNLPQLDPLYISTVQPRRPVRS